MFEIYVIQTSRTVYSEEFCLTAVLYSFHVLGCLSVRVLEF